ncbi:MAG: hypothetical protein NVS9B4_01030 [Candidatus Acidiferrum sp.]
MYTFRKTQNFASIKYPGISAVVNAPTVKLRSEIDMAISEHPQRGEYYQLLLDRESIDGDAIPARIKRAALNEKVFALERAQRVGPTISACIESLTGIQNEDGTPMTPAQLAEYGPADLCEELVDCVQFNMRLSAVEEKNSSLPLPSSAPAPAATPNTTAQNVNGTAGTVNETAPSISLIKHELAATNG